MWIPLKREINLKTQAAVIERGFWHVSLILSEMVGEDCITQFFFPQPTQSIAGVTENVAWWSIENVSEMTCLTAA